MDGNQDKIVINDLKPFDKQVDDVLSGADATSSHLEVLKVTPPLLRMAGVPNLPILMTARHVKTITQESGTDSANYHGLGVDLVKRLPELISDPVMIMDSLTKDDSIVVVTQTVDKENRPVIGAIRLAGRGNDLNGFEISANILTSAYGKDNFQSFLERNIEQGSVLYVDKEKSQELSKTPGIQFPDNFESLSFNTIIRKTNAFVNSAKENNSKNTERSEENMIADTKNATARERIQQVRDDMVKTLLEHIEKNPTDWQSGWNNIAAGAPYNGKTNTAYRGINALYLALIGAKQGYKDARWVTFNQAKELGASVKKGEKSSPVIFFEIYDRATKKAFSSLTVKDMTDEEKTTYMKENVYAVMKYSSVFNAEQCHNFPERKEIAMSEEERAKQNIKIEAIIANSSAPIRYDGGSRAYYSPGTDSIHLPVIQAFNTMQDYCATVLHEIAHSTGHESRLNRNLSGGFGSESYAREELCAELACVFMQMEQGIQLNGKHITNHAAYLNSWLEAAKKDTSVFFKAAADAQRVADYVAQNYLQKEDSAVLEEDEKVVLQNKSPQDMAEITQNKAFKTHEWLSIELPNESVGGKYGESTMIKMPKGEYSYYAFYVSSKMLKNVDGKLQLNVASDYVYRLNNDGRQVELTGAELKDSFAGMTIGKQPVRVAPSRAYAKTYEALEKNVPEEMKALPNWCVYKTFQREDKDKKGKVLKSAVTGEGASSKRASDWTDFNTAMEYAKQNGYAGVSFLLEAKNGITCIDLDECIKNAQTGEMKERAEKLIEGLKGTYMERSTSGNGVHIFIKDDVLKNGKYRSTSVNAEKGDLEVYDNQRVISMTGDMLSETNNLIRAGSAMTVYLRRELGEQRQEVKASSTFNRVTFATEMSDSELIGWIRGSKKGRDFDDLYSGKGISGNKSNDDAKLAHMLLYFSGGEKEQTFRIMRESGSYRPEKSDDYYRHTIEEMDKKITDYAHRPRTEEVSSSNRNNGKKKTSEGKDN